jgi:hypothetical protein
VKLEVEHTTKPLRLTSKCAACKNGPPLAPCVRTSYPEALDTRSRVKLGLLTLDKLQFFIIVYLQHQLSRKVEDVQMNSGVHSVRKSARIVNGITIFLGFPF